MSTASLETPVSIYESNLLAWQQTLDDSLRSEDGWLTLAGLYWLHEGKNTLGSDANGEIILPDATIPAALGTITLQDGISTLHLTASEPVTIDGIDGVNAVIDHEIILENDRAEQGPTVVRLRAVSFFVIKRGDTYGIRVRDRNNPDRLRFTGRKWFEADSSYRVQAKFIAHPTTRHLLVPNVHGRTSLMDNPGYVEFTLHDRTFSLEAFGGDKGELLIVFRDQTSGVSTYGSSRFLSASVGENGTVDLDFNRAYNPPCAFTPYAACPLPLKENILPIAIEVGEQF